MLKGSIWECSLCGGEERSTNEYSPRKWGTGNVCWNVSSGPPMKFSACGECLAKCRETANAGKSTFNISKFLRKLFRIETS